MSIFFWQVVDLSRAAGFPYGKPGCEYLPSRDRPALELSKDGTYRRCGHILVGDGKRCQGWADKGRHFAVAEACYSYVVRNAHTGFDQSAADAEGHVITAAYESRKTVAQYLAQVVTGLGTRVCSLTRWDIRGESALETVEYEIPRCRAMSLMVTGLFLTSLAPAAARDAR